VSNYPNLIQRVFDTPLMILESKLQTILTVLAPRAEFRMEAPGDLESLKGRGIHISARNANHKIGWSRNNHLMVNRTAVLDVMGTLVQRCGGMDAASGLCSYESLSADLNTMMADDDIDSILMIIDSPGGEATSGVFDLADQIYSARKAKPIYAYAHDMATSAAYLIGSAATQLHLPETGAVGSIGVVTAHLDVSKKAEKDGVAMTYIYAGRHKVDGNPFEPLSDNVRTKVQDRVNTVYNLFTSRVAKYRGLSEHDVIDTEADVYHGEDAVTMGLADGIASFDNYLNNLLANTDRTQPTHEVKLMSDKDTTAVSETLNAEQIIKQHPDAAVVLIDRGAKVERERISAILQHDHAEGRLQLAEHLAFNTSMLVEDAAAMLAASPKQVQQVVGTTPFETAMNAIDNPDIGAGHEEVESTPQAMAQSLVAQLRKAGSIQ
jgi:capsid assembly protease